MSAIFDENNIIVHDEVEEPVYSMPNYEEEIDFSKTVIGEFTYERPETE